MAGNMRAKVAWRSFIHNLTFLSKAIYWSEHGPAWFFFKKIILVSAVCARHHTFKRECL